MHLLVYELYIFKFIYKLDIRGYHSGVAEDSRLLVCYAVWVGEKFQMLRRVFVGSPS